MCAQKVFCFSPRRDGISTVTPTGMMVLDEAHGKGEYTVVLSLLDKLGIVGGSPLLRVFEGTI